MKQYNYELTNISELDSALKSIYSEIDGVSYKSILFHLYTIRFDDDDIRIVQSQILEMFPAAIIGGTSSNGDICDGHLAESGMVIAVSVFENTVISSQLYKCELGQEADIGKQIADKIDSTKDIVAAEILITLKSINSHTVLDKVEDCHKD
ncbi:MAG: hypothetical protein IJ675_02920, partial [Pseudobutyrivibrio sp.]|nr:hypothetical protein [Pseudobutyrivibrio sp.]